MQRNAQTKAAPAKKAAAPRRLGEEALAKRVSWLCAKDDAEGLRALMESQGVGAGDELAHFKSAIECAMEKDAGKCFEALLGLDGKGRGRGLGLRLWGGQKPVHRCAHMPEDSDFEGHGAPSCLAVALALDPMEVLRADEERRTALDWAACSPSRDTFAMLADQLGKLAAQGLATEVEAKAAAGKAAFVAVASLADPKLAMERVERLSPFFGPWRSLRSPHGQSLLGAALGNEAADRGRPETAMALLDAGASPMSPHVEEPSYFSKEKAPPPKACAERVFGLVSTVPSLAPELFAKFVEKLSDSEFEDVCAKRRDGEGRLGLPFMMSEEQSAMVRGRLAAIEAAKLASQVPSAKRSSPKRRI